MKALLAVTIAALSILAACNRKPPESETAVRQALDRYLASRTNLNMRGMDMEVGAIQFRGDDAETDVTFHARGDAKAALTLHYMLKRQGSRWEVVPKAGGHGATMPPASGEAGGLPSGHPAIGSAPAPATPPPASLPPDHPPLKSE